MRAIPLSGALLAASVSFTAANPVSAFWWVNNEKELRAKAKLLKPQQLIDDFQRNENRFEINWVESNYKQILIAANGYVRDDQITRWGFTLKLPQKVRVRSGQMVEFIIECRNIYDEEFTKDITLLDKRDFVKITFNIAAFNGALSQVEVVESGKYGANWVWLKTENCMLVD